MILCKSLRRYNIPFKRSLENVLSRFYDSSIDMDDKDVIIRLTADNPLPDYLFLQEMKEIWNKSDCNYLASESTKNNIPKGLSAEFFYVSKLREAYQYANTQFEKEHVTPYIIENSNCKYFDNSFLSKKFKSKYGIDNLDDYCRVYNLMKA